MTHEPRPTIAVAALGAALALLVPTLAGAAKPPARSPLEMVPDETVASVIRPTMRVEAASGRPIAVYHPLFEAGHSTPEDMARQYLAARARLLRLDAPDLDDLALRMVRSGPAGHTVRFRQLVAGVPVWGPDLAVTIDRDDRVTYVANGYLPGLTLESAEPAIGGDAARTNAVVYLDARGPFAYDRSDLVVYPERHRGGGATARLAWRVTVHPRWPRGEWEVLIDAANGGVIRAEDRAFYGTPMTVDGDGDVFLPDPLSSALATYGDTGYVDGADADTAQLLAEIFNVPLLDITLDGGIHSLTGPWAECVDWALPFKGCFAQAGSSFTFTRSADGFEAAHGYYHIDTYMRYMNDTLGVAVHPHQYPGGVQFDPHGFNGADNSSYSSGSGRLQFGEGGVDDAEDADVLIHELGHGIHDWVTGGSLSQVQGLSEGTGDYFAVSYSRSFNQWQPSDPQFNWVFSWDGHNPFWGGRVTDWNDTHPYPGGLTGQIHTDGQIWASCNIDIHELIGGEPIDRAMLVGLGMTNSGTNQEDAAQAVLQAAIDLAYPSGEIATIASVYQGCGYQVTQPPIFADGFESGDTSAWSTTVP